MPVLELAGVALAVLALMVSICEDYKRCDQKLRLWSAYHNEFEKVCDRLDRVRLRYIWLLRAVLQLKLAEWRQLQAHPVQFDQKELEARLRRRMSPQELTVYTKTIAHLEKALSQLRDRLVNKEGEASLVTGEIRGSSSVWKRAIFVFRGDLRTAFLDNIEILLSGLEKLHQAHDSFSRAGWNLPHTILGPTQEQRGYWQEAHTFHSVMATAWTCSCRLAHCADLLLGGNVPQDLSTKVMLYHDRTGNSRLTGQRLPWTSMSTRSMTVTISVIAPPTNPPVSAHVAARSTPMLSFVKHARGLVSQPGQTDSLTPQTDSASPMITASQSIHECISAPPRPIADMCELFTGCPDECDARITSVQPALNFRKARSSAGEQTTVTLDSLLSPGTATRLSRELRLRLAAKITCSLLVFHLDNWLYTTYTAADVIFLVNNGIENVKQPFLRRFHNSRDSIARPNFVPLGLLLVRLCFGTSLERSMIGEAWPSPDLKPNDIAATRWANIIEDELGPGYAGPVEWCLRSHDGCLDFQSDLEDEFFDEVIVPLQQCHDFWSKSKVALP